MHDKAGGLFLAVVSPHNAGPEQISANCSYMWFVSTIPANSTGHICASGLLHNQPTLRTDNDFCELDKDGRKQVQCKGSSHRDPCMQMSVSLGYSDARILECSNARVLECPNAFLLHGRLCLAGLRATIGCGGGGGPSA